MATPPNHGITENELKCLLETVRKHGAQIAELEGERSARPAARAVDATSAAQSNPSKYIRTEAYDVLLRKYHEMSEQKHDLFRRYQQSQERGDLLQRKYNDLKAKYGKAHEIAKQWKLWYDRQKLRQGDGNEKTDQRGTLSPIAELGPACASNIKDFNDVSSHTADAREALPSPVPQPALDPLQQQLNHASSTPRASSAQAPCSALHRHPSSQSTEIPSSPPPAVTASKRDYSSDEEPTVVSSRTIRPSKRIKHGPSGQVKVKLEPASQDHPIELNSGDFSSPRGKTPTMVPQISDLDSGKRSGQLRPRRNPTLARVRSRSEEYAPRTRQGLLHQSSSLSQNNERATIVQEDPKTAEDSSGSRATVVSGILQPISGNTVLEHQSVKSGKRRRRTSHGIYSKIGELSEGGDGTQRPRRNDQESPKRILSAEVKQRLDSLLDAPSPSAQLDLAAKINPARKELRGINRPAANEPRQGSNVPSAVAAKVGSPSVLLRDKGGSRTVRDDSPRQTLILAPAPPPPPRPVEQRQIPKSLGPPLRSLQPASLRLDDFKINPRYQDTDFAFTDTLRGREARRCLPGCTKPDCCGSAFRKAVELAGGKGPSHMSDAQVLEAYLGPTWELTMGSYGPEKRKEVLLNARTAAFANEFGKHKMAFAKHSTPPGFWTADFPDTQEAAEYRAMASQMEKDKVEGRYREAMRQNGRWIFRDES